jgi:hypothetical protein
MIQKFFTDKTGKIVIGQKPNLPIIVWVLASILKRLIGTTHSFYSYIDMIGFLAIIIWALLEIFQGNSPFRRMLGLVVIVFSLYIRTA